jgi:hypothetical protein
MRELTPETFAGNWKQSGAAWDRSQWREVEQIGFYTLRHRDSEILTISNAEQIQKEFREKLPGEENVTWAVHEFSHWAVGWVTHLMVRVYTPHGKLTNSWKLLEDLHVQMQDYPVLNEEDYSDKEETERLENVTESLRHNFWYMENYNTDEEWAALGSTVLDWLENSEHQNFVHDHYYAEKKMLEDALEGLGIDYQEEE